MLEETEAEETKGVFVTFLSLVTFQLWGGGIPGYAYVLGSSSVRRILKRGGGGGGGRNFRKFEKNKDLNRKLSHQI